MNEEDSKKVAQAAADSFQVNSRQQATETSITLLGEARRTVDVLLYDYDELLLPHAEITDLLPTFFRQHQRNQFRYLCSESNILHERGGALVQLARRFSTFIKLRQLPDGLKPVNEQFLLIDSHSSMQTRDHRSSDYYVHLNNRVRGRQLEHRFEELWQRSTAVPGIHVTGL